MVYQFLPVQTALYIVDIKRLAAEGEAVPNFINVPAVNLQAQGIGFDQGRPLVFCFLQIAGGVLPDGIRALGQADILPAIRQAERIVDTIRPVCGDHHIVKMAGQPLGKFPIGLMVLYEQIPNRGACAGDHGMAPVLVALFIVLQNCVICRPAVLEYPHIPNKIHEVASADGLDRELPEIPDLLNPNVLGNAAAEKIIRLTLALKKQLDLNLLHAGIQVFFLVLRTDQTRKLKPSVVVELLSDMAGQDIQRLEWGQLQHIFPHNAPSLIFCPILNGADHLKGRLFPRLHIGNRAVENAVHQLAANRGEEYNVIDLGINSMPLKFKPAQHGLAQRLRPALIEDISGVDLFQNGFHAVGGGLHLNGFDCLVKQIEGEIGASQQIGLDDLGALLGGIFQPRNLLRHVHKGNRKQNRHLLLEQRSILKLNFFSLDDKPILADIQLSLGLFPPRLYDLLI